MLVYQRVNTFYDSTEFPYRPPGLSPGKVFGRCSPCTLRCGVWPQDGPGSGTKKWDGGTINGQLTNQNAGHLSNKHGGKYYIDVYRYIDILRSHNVIYNYYVYIYVCV